MYQALHLDARQDDILASVPPPLPLDRSAFALMFGVILPALAILVEATLHPLRNQFLDPLATPFHWLACLSVPSLSLWGWVRPHAKWTPFTAAFALVISLFYCVTFGPLLLMGLILTLIVLGFLPLSPLLAAIASGQQLVRCRQFRYSRALQGAGCAALLLLMAEGPPALVRHAVTTGQVSADERWLPGFEWHLSDVCDSGHSSRTLLEGWLATAPDAANACRLMYRLTGKQPVGHAQVDLSRGGIATGAVRPDLQLVASTIDGGLEPGTPVSQLRWDLEFRNVGSAQEEARFRLALPPQAVVNSATLWVDGEPREAAFGGTRVVREAYRKVAIVQRRDPLLVTWAGPNEVFVQCFPVPAGGEMRIRLSIAAPVSAATGEVAMPLITEHNFGQMREPAVVASRQHGSLEPVTVRDPRDGEASLLAHVESMPAPRELFVVVDGSEWMAKHQAIEGRLRQLRNRYPMRVWLAGDHARELKADDPLRGFEGGADNVPALERALSAAGPETWVLWIHGPQPYLWASPVVLEALAKRPARFIGYRVEPGVNEVWNSLARASAVNLVPDLTMSRQVWEFEHQATPAAKPGPALASVWAGTQPAAVAQDYRVVTREVGAVVLERQQQYAENGLQDPDAPATETPEPATWIMMASAFFGLTWYHRRHQRSASSIQ